MVVRRWSKSVTLTWKQTMSAHTEVEVADRSEIFESIASRLRPTAVISWTMSSVASAERGSAGRVAERGGSSATPYA
ncbi:hypothetical protein NDU88_005185 [Pleurodeles waltl]|uniref:Uncharacterized protein n=1 Tax=Pleurodeles waltl TaxID=8319 RepID=A0AAV7NN84_PLEWA|nr:hypothetical protein NDU88_005185 [Pleurodeles waltl]